MRERLTQRVRWTVDHALPRLGIAQGARHGDVMARVVLAAGTEDELPSVIDEVRAAGPIVRGRAGAVTVSHAAAKEILSSNDFAVNRFGRDATRLGRIGAWASRDMLHPIEPPSMLMTNPPDHTRYRKLVTRVFTARAVAALREQVQGIADELLDSLDPTDPVDLVDRYCGLLPVTVISTILGVPVAEREHILALGEAIAPSLDMGMPWRQFRTTDDALHEFDSWLGDHLDRLAADPGDDLLSRLVTARDDGEGLTERELRSTAGLVLAAGFETTVNLLGNGIALLAAHPDQLAAVRDGRADWAGAVEEILRVDPPVLLTARQATVDTQVVGEPVAAGTRIVTVLAGANSDPEVFEDPDAFDVTRSNAAAHISFGAGRHHCLGASLARMEGEVGLRTIFERHPDLTLRPGARRRDTRILRGYRTLPAVLGTTASV